MVPRKATVVPVSFLLFLIAFSQYQVVASRKSSGGSGGNRISSSDSDNTISSSADDDVGGVYPNSGGNDRVKCVCDGSCEHLRAEECRHGVTFDMCHCCLVCARGENEPCGGALGTCAFGLHCQLNDDEHSVALNDLNSSSSTPLLAQEGTCSSALPQTF